MSEIEFQSLIMADERAELREGRDYEALREYEDWLDSLTPTMEELNEQLEEMFRRSG